MSSPRSSSPDRRRPLFARFYAGMTDRMDTEGLGELRTELLAGLSGRVVEVGCGNGRNFTHYPPAVSAVEAVEPEPHLRALATTAAARAPVPVTVQGGRAGALPLDTAGVDAGVLCLVLCAIPDPRDAVAELARVIRPGGTLVFLEHCAAETRGLRMVQRAADATVWPLLTGGCHTARDPLAAITAGGFATTAVRRLRYPPARPTVPASPHVLGEAQRQ